jgi:uncharacterized glyoxalase superfamily protein PhnB
MKPSTAAQQQRIDFYKAALSATEQVCLADPRGKVMQAEIRIGNARLSRLSSPPPSRRPNGSNDIVAQSVELGS